MPEAVILAFARWRFIPDAGFMGRTGPGARTSALVFFVLFVHSLPGTYSFRAAYSGDADYEPSESALLTQTITP